MFWFNIKQELFIMNIFISIISIMLLICQREKKIVKYEDLQIKVRQCKFQYVQYIIVFNYVGLYIEI